MTFTRTDIRSYEISNKRVDQKCITDLLQKNLNASGKTYLSCANDYVFKE